ncbi:hypothetical protein [Acutalibacter muris]
MVCCTEETDNGSLLELYCRHWPPTGGKGGHSP